MRVHQVLHLGRRQLRFDVDGDAVIGGVVDDMDLIMRVLVRSKLAIDRTSFQDAVLVQRHGELPLW